MSTSISTILAKITNIADEYGLSQEKHEYQPSEDVRRVEVASEIFEKALECREIEKKRLQMELRTKSDPIFHPLKIEERITMVQKLVEHLQYCLDNEKEIGDFLLLNSHGIEDTINVPWRLHGCTAKLPEVLIDCFNALPLHLEMLESFSTTDMNYDTESNLKILKQKVTEIYSAFSKMKNLQKKMQGFTNNAELEDCSIIQASSIQSSMQEAERIRDCEDLDCFSFVQPNRELIRNDSHFAIHSTPIQK